MKRIKTLLLTLALCLTLAPTALGAESPSFVDVPQGHWAYDYVKTAQSQGWINGVSDNTFAPAGSVTGAQFITMVVRAFYPGDIPAGTADPWYSPYVAAGDTHALRENADMADATGLSTPMTRYQMAVVMGNLLADAQVDTDIPDLSGAISDWDSIPDAYRQSVAQAYTLGLLTGVDDAGTFAGEQGMNRAQSAAVLCRLRLLLPVQSPGTDPITPADMVSDEALLAQANTRLVEQYLFLYGLKAGAVFQQDWSNPITETAPDGTQTMWFPVTEPGVSSLSDIKAVWHTYFAQAWPTPSEYLSQYKENRGRLYTANMGIGDDLTFLTIQAERVESRTGTSAVLQATAYHEDPNTNVTSTVPYRCEMTWEGGQWCCSGLFLLP